MTNGLVKEWQDLVRLTGVVFDQARAKLVGLRNQEERLLATLASLDGRPAQDPENSGPDDPAQRAGANVLWQQWVDHRRTELNMELARTRVRIDAARQEVARAYGKHHAIEDIARSELRARNGMRQKRSERDQSP